MLDQIICIHAGFMEIIASIVAWIELVPCSTAGRDDERARLLGEEPAQFNELPCLWLTTTGVSEDCPCDMVLRHGHVYTQNSHFQRLVEAQDDVLRRAFWGLTPPTYY